MNTAQTPVEIQTLCDRIQRELEQLQPLHAPIKVQCGLKPGALSVLVQHNTQVESESVASTVRRAIVQFLQDHPLGLGVLSMPLFVRLYLRRTGMTVPYVSRSLQIDALVEASTTATDPEGAVQPDAAIDRSDPDESPASDPDFASEPGAAPPADGTLVPVFSDLSDLEEDETPTYLPQYPPKPLLSGLEAGQAASKSQRWTPAIALGIVVGAIALAGGLYALSRPCVIGACPLLTESETVGQAAIATAQTTRSALAVVDAYEQLTEASYRLGTIPTWSPYYDAAQAILSRFESDSVLLGEVVTALRQANEAAKKSQNPPHPLPQWREIQGHWRKAIALLQEIPSSSPVYPLVQRKQIEYQANLDIINQRLRLEQTAQETVKTARSNARLADTQERIARSLNDWSQAKTTWQTVANALNQVPPGTMMHAEAQQLLAIYQPRLLQVGDRLRQEELAQSAYEKALAFAAEAQAAERNSQWSEAVVAWRSALNATRQVPSSSSYHGQVQPLLASYQTALNAAQENLRIAVAYQGAEADLTRVCSQVCTYNPSRGAIQIRLSSAYEEAVEQAIFADQSASATAYDADITSRVSTLLWTVSSIGGSARVPVVLFKADGSRLGTYDPALSGYVQR